MPAADERGRRRFVSGEATSSDHPMPIVCLCACKACIDRMLHFPSESSHADSEAPLTVRSTNDCQDCDLLSVYSCSILSPNDGDREYNRNVIASHGFARLAQVLVLGKCHKVLYVIFFLVQCCRAKSEFPKQNCTVHKSDIKYQILTVLRDYF